MKFCIIGLGNFGTHLARQLSRDGHEIVAVDNDPGHIITLKEEIEYIIQADCTDLNAFHEIPVEECDAVIVAIGADFEDSLSIAANLQQLGARRIISRVINPLHGRLLKLLKVDELLIPEAMAAAWLARTLDTPDMINSFELGTGHEISQIQVPSSLVGTALQQADLREGYGLNLITIAKGRSQAGLTSTRNPIQKVLGIPQPTREFEADDILVLFGRGRDIRRFIRDHEK